MNIPRIRGTIKLEIYISDLAKIAFKRYCEKHRIPMKDMIDHLIREFLLRKDPDLLKVDAKTEWRPNL